MVKATENAGDSPGLGLHENANKIDVNGLENGWMRLCRRKRMEMENTHLTPPSNDSDTL